MRSQDLASYYRSYQVLGVFAVLFSLLGMFVAPEINRGIRIETQSFSSWSLWAYGGLAGAFGLFAILFFYYYSKREPRMRAGYWFVGLATLFAIIGCITLEPILIVISVLPLVVSSICVFMAWRAYRNRDIIPFSEYTPGRPSKYLTAAGLVCFSLLGVVVGSVQGEVIANTAGEEILPPNYSINGAYQVGETQQNKRIAVMYGMGEESSSKLLIRLDERLRSRVESGELEVSYLYVLPPGAERNSNVQKAVAGTICAARQSDTDKTAYMRYVAEMARDADGGPIVWGERAGLGSDFSDCVYSGDFEDVARSILVRQKNAVTDGDIPSIGIIGDDAAYAELTKTLDVVDSAKREGK